MRGEYSTGHPLVLAPWELPPHARRILSHGCGAYGKRGTTSACAENTVYDMAFGRWFGNYLRMRGEYCPLIAATFALMELPPHARRIPENRRGASVRSRNYLRMRGEYLTAIAIDCLFAELPPHARRILPRIWGGVRILGTTSACAENTSPACLAPLLVSELPPHARRILHSLDPSLYSGGTTSACAENTLASR